MVVLLNLVLVVGAWVTINPLGPIQGAERAGIRSALWLGSEGLWRKVAPIQFAGYSGAFVDSVEILFCPRGQRNRDASSTW
jgi:hypothetical protein